MHPVEASEQGSFAAARWPDKRSYLILVDRQRYCTESVNVSVIIEVEVSDLNLNQPCQRLYLHLITNLPRIVSTRIKRVITKEAPQA